MHTPPISAGRRGYGGQTAPGARLCALKPGLRGRALLQYKRRERTEPKGIRAGRQEGPVRKGLLADRFPEARRGGKAQARETPRLYRVQVIVRRRKDELRIRWDEGLISESGDLKVWRGASPQGGRLMAGIGGARRRGGVSDGEGPAGQRKGFSPAPAPATLGPSVSEPHAGLRASSPLICVFHPTALIHFKYTTHHHPVGQSFLCPHH